MTIAAVKEDPEGEGSDNEEMKLENQDAVMDMFMLDNDDQFKSLDQRPNANSEKVIPVKRVNSKGGEKFVTEHEQAMKHIMEIN